MSDEKQASLKKLLLEVKNIAVRYRELTGKPLGVTGEIAELEAAEKLGLTLVEARCPGFDAILGTEGKEEKFQIKGRAVSPSERYRGRVPSIRCDGEFDAVLLVLLSRENFDALEIWRVERAAILERLKSPGSKARNERGSLAISQFVSKLSNAVKVWPSV